MLDAGFQRQDCPLFAEYLQHLDGADAASLLSPNRQLDASDALLVIDMQNDFVPAADAKFGGRFAVPEGDLIAPFCAQLISRTVEVGGCVVATRDYHPVDHCSFLPDGPFPPHCVQGTVGSKLYPPVADAMEKAMLATMKDDKPDGRVSIGYKGFHEDVDSFSGFPYVDGGDDRICKRCELAPDPFSGCTSAPWTGCLLLKCSGQCFAGSVDVDAPPDILAAAQDKPRGVQNLREKLQECGARRLVVCGLAFDYCVIDTALNARNLGFRDVSIVVDAARASHVPGLGQYGSGFLQDPAEVVAKLRKAGVMLTSTAALTGSRLHLPSTVPPPQYQGQFPSVLQPFGVQRVDGLKFLMGADRTSFSMIFAISLAHFARMCGRGFCTPAAPVTLPAEARELAKIPAAAKTFAFAYPQSTVASMNLRSRTGFLSTHHDANWRFLCYGGFLYFDDDFKVLAANAVGPGKSIFFGAPQPWRPEYTSRLVTERRFQPVTLTNMLRVGACYFAWIHAGETLQGEPGPWEPAVHGAFAYLFHEDPMQVSDKDVYFPVTVLHESDPKS